MIPIASSELPATYCAAPRAVQAPTVEIGKLPAAPGLPRSTASVVEQKSRVPVLLKVIGAAPTTNVLLVPPAEGIPVAARLYPDF